MSKRFSFSTVSIEVLSVFDAAFDSTEEKTVSEKWQ